MKMLKRLILCLNMKNKKIISTLKQNQLLVFLLGLIVFTRIIFLLNQNINFVFDQGKDSLAILNIWLNKKPTLIGPWTSIPGLFFGPAYYYLLLPFYIIANGNPVFAVIPMVILLILSVIVFYKKFDKTAALILATSPIAWTITTSAWNPFPMVFISVLILFFLDKLKQKNNIKDYFFVFLFASFGFHFSTAFAIFYPIIIILTLLINKVKINITKIFSSCLGFFIPFIPQLLFEVRHSFLQTKAVIKYLSNGGDNQFSLNKILEVFKITLGEFKVYTLPTIRFNNINSFLFIGLILYGIYLLIKNRKKIDYKKFVELAIWIIIPVFSYFFLHFNLWYLLGLAPVVILITSKIINKLPRLIKNFLLLLFIISPFLQLNDFYTNQSKINDTNDFLKNKKEVITYIYNQANNQSFSSYQYEPAIYDYSYQYLFFQSALKNYNLPFEFTYKPGEISYVKEKTELLEYFADQIYKTPPEKIFFIVEKADNEDHLKEWWNHQHYSQIILEKDFGSSIKVYEALP